jgi:kinesin family protein 18/19
MVTADSDPERESVSDAPGSEGGGDEGVPPVHFHRASDPPTPVDNESAAAKIGGESNILVAVRCRPMNAREEACGHDSVVKVMDGSLVVVTDPPAKENDFLRANKTREKRYAFDHAFDEKTPQESIFKSTTKLLIDGVMNGYNATVFAYGATGTGKTYTMIGTPTSPGLMVQTVEEFFVKVRANTDKKFTVKLSYLEVYNELIHDLLRGGGSNPEAAKLDLREDVAEGVKVAGLSSIEANTTDEVMELLRQGNQHRTMEPTHANAVSSRSHAVLQITCEQRESTADTHQTVKIGKLSLIDLAGSERASMTHNVGARMIEGANINRSLLALGNCINALAGNSKQRGYIPYRDSKLTRLLKDSLGGNCRTVMICTCSPSHLYYEETLNTLKYANRAKNIKTTQTRNTNEVDAHIAQYVNIIADLRAEISNLKAEKRAAPSLPRIGNGSGSGQPGNRSDTDDHERIEMEKLRGAIQGNYREKREVKSQLLELNDLNLNNKIQVSKKQLEVHRWEKDNMQSDKPVPSWVAAARNDIKTARQNVTKNTRLQRELELKERDLQEECDMLKDQVRRVGLSEERRMLLETEFEVKELELEKMQMRQLAKTHANQLQDRDLRVRKLVQQVEGANDVIRRQKNVLEEHDIHLAEELGPTPFTPPQDAVRGDNLRLSLGRQAGGEAAGGGERSWGKREPTVANGRRAGTASQRGSGANSGNSRFPELRAGQGSRAVSTAAGSGRQRSARSRQASREKGGLLRDMERLRTASVERENNRNGGGAGGGGDGPPVLVTVTPRREHEDSRGRERREPSRGGGGYSRQGGGGGHGGASRQGEQRPSSIDPSVRSNELEYGRQRRMHGQEKGGRRLSAMTARSSPSDRRAGQNPPGSRQNAGRHARTPVAPRGQAQRRDPYHRPRDGFGYKQQQQGQGQGQGQKQQGQAGYTPSRQRPPSGYSGGGGGGSNGSWDSGSASKRNPYK